MREDPTSKSRLSSSRQQNAINMGFRLQADDDPTLYAGLVDLIFQGIQTSIAKKPYVFVIF